jgi:hypothetical protein
LDSIKPFTLDDFAEGHALAVDGDIDDLLPGVAESLLIEINDVNAEAASGEPVDGRGEFSKSDDMDRGGDGNYDDLNVMFGIPTSMAVDLEARNWSRENPLPPLVPASGEVPPVFVPFQRTADRLVRRRPAYFMGIASDKPDERKEDESLYHRRFSKDLHWQAMWRLRHRSFAERNELLSVSLLNNIMEI